MARVELLTLMAVHAHPDDEASSTGGILAHYALEGVRTVVVTCTNGDLGDAPGGIKPGEPGHDEASVAAIRRKELEASCSILGVGELETLGYHDSGMAGWSENNSSSAFASLPVDVAAQPLIALMERYRPEVVVTYDANGFYGHPDHIQAHRITVAAADATRIPDKLFYPVFPRSILPRFREALRGPEFDGVEDEPDPDFGVPDEAVDAAVNCKLVVDQKYHALEAHASQTAESFFMKLGRERFQDLFGIEYFVYAAPRLGIIRPEHDLFAGLR
jgi:LmbE family N-acetylglucosaminyl deacetylase